jgi:hypothetical protein
MFQRYRQSNFEKGGKKMIGVGKLCFGNWQLAIGAGFCGRWNIFLILF